MLKITNESDYLIHLVRCAIHDLQPQELPEELDFDRVFQWGLYHNVANIAFYSLEKLGSKPKPKLYAQWEAHRDQAIALDINQAYATQELRDAFQSAGIRNLEVQGTKIKPLYPQPDFRTMSDIDFIIDEENIPKARGILENLGYECEEVYRVELNAERPPNINIEMHTEFFLEDFAYRQILHSPFDLVDEQEQCRINAFYLYNILHLAKHYFYSGCGIRRVLDVYYLNKNYGHIVDRDYIQKALQAAEIVDFVAELEHLANLWFGAEEKPFPQNKMVNYILNAGVHGSLYNEQQKSVEKKFRNTGLKARVKYYLGRFFGTREDLQIRYPVLKKHRILYPFCWCCRLLSALRPRSLRRIRNEVDIVTKMEKTEA